MKKEFSRYLAEYPLSTFCPDDDQRANEVVVLHAHDPVFTVNFLKSGIRRTPRAARPCSH